MALTENVREFIANTHGQLTCCAAETKLLRLDDEVQIKGPAGLVSVRAQICLQDDIHKEVI